MHSNTAQSVLRVEILQRIPGLRHGFTTRRTGAGRLLGNALLERLDLSDHRAVHLRQVHGSRVIRVTDEGEPRVPETADGSVTPLPRTVLMVRTADCVALLAADPERRVIGAAHAGWRGVSGQIPAALVGVMTEEFRCRPGDMLVGIGPAIGPCCYSIGEEVRRIFAERGRDTSSGDFFEAPDGRLHLNLHAAVVRQLRAAGIPAGHIETIGLCTACHPELLHSYRRDGAGPDRMHAFITWTD